MDFFQLKIEIARVNKAFYDAVYGDPWLKLVFEGVKQEFIESQQTDFMLGALGGPKEFSGRGPRDAHPHIYVTEEMWAVRKQLLQEAFRSTNFPAELGERWLRIDEAFKNAIVKQSPLECRGRYTRDKVIQVADPLQRCPKKTG